MKLTHWESSDQRELTMTTTTKRRFCGNNLKHKLFCYARRRNVSVGVVHRIINLLDLPPTLSVVPAKRNHHSEYDPPRNYRDRNDYRGITEEEYARGKRCIDFYVFDHSETC